MYVHILCNATYIHASVDLYNIVMIEIVVIKACRLFERMIQEIINSISYVQLDDKSLVYYQPCLLIVQTLSHRETLQDYSQ